MDIARYRSTSVAVWLLSSLEGFVSEILGIAILWRVCTLGLLFFFFSSRRRHTRCSRDWSSDVCSSDLWFLADNLNLGFANGLLHRGRGQGLRLLFDYICEFQAQVAGICGKGHASLQINEIGRASCRERV